MVNCAPCPIPLLESKALLPHVPGRLPTRGGPFGKRHGSFRWGNRTSDDLSSTRSTRPTIPRIQVNPPARARTIANVTGPGGRNKSPRWTSARARRPERESEYAQDREGSDFPRTLRPANDILFSAFPAPREPSGGHFRSSWITTSPDGFLDRDGEVDPGRGPEDGAPKKKKSFAELPVLGHVRELEKVGEAHVGLANDGRGPLLHKAWCRASCCASKRDERGHACKKKKKGKGTSR